MLIKSTIYDVHCKNIQSLTIFEKTNCAHFYQMFYYKDVKKKKNQSFSAENRTSAEPSLEQKDNSLQPAFSFANFSIPVSPFEVSAASVGSTQGLALLDTGDSSLNLQVLECSFHILFGAVCMKCITRSKYKCILPRDGVGVGNGAGTGIGIGTGTETGIGACTGILGGTGN